MTDDQLLIQQLSNPQTQRRAFETVVRQNSERLYWQIRRFVLSHEDANDVLQNTFIKAWQGLGSFHGDSKLLTWLSRIAINESLDFLRIYHDCFPECPFSLSELEKRLRKYRRHRKTFNVVDCG